MHVLRNGFCGTLNIAEIGLLIAVQGGRHADAYTVQFRDPAEVISCGKHPSLNDCREIFVNYIPYVVDALVYHVHFVRLNVKADDLVCSSGLLNSQW